MDYEFDEVDVAMSCLMTEAEYLELEQASEKELTYTEDLAIEESNVDTMNLLLDESETDYIGLGAEEDIDTEQELLAGLDDDDDLIDMVAQVI